MRVEYDKEANLAYVYLREIEDGGVEKTSHVEDYLFLDWGHDGRLVGIEVLDAEGLLPASLLKEEPPEWEKRLMAQAVRENIINATAMDKGCRRG